MNDAVTLVVYTGLGGLVVTHSAAGAKGPGFNSPVVRENLIFNSWASTLVGKQCWLCAAQLHTNCDRIMQRSGHVWYGT